MMIQALSKILAPTLIISYFYLLPSAKAWNSDYAYDLPKQRHLCAQQTKNQVKFIASPSDQDCPQGSRRFLAIFGQNPRGSLALIPLKSSSRYYPPLKIKWSDNKKLSNLPLWHFTCVRHQEKEILGTQPDLIKYLAELTADGRKDCFSVRERALEACQKKFGGNELIEDCSLAWGN